MWRYGLSRLVALVLLFSFSPLWAIEVPDETWNEIKKEISNLETLNSELQTELTKSKEQVEQLLPLGPALQNTSELLKTSQQTAVLQYNDLNNSYEKQSKKLAFQKAINLAEVFLIALFGGLWYGSSH